MARSDERGGRGGVPRGRRAAVVLVLLAACRAGGAPAPDPGRGSAPPAPATASAADWTLESSVSGYRVYVQPSPAPVPLNEPFALVVRVETASGELPEDDLQLAVDADMPAHGHGMLRRPRTERSGPGAWRTDGMLLHMPGRWVVTFDLSRGPLTERAEQALTLP